MTGSEAAASAECQNGDAHAITPPKHVRKYVKPKVFRRSDLEIGDRVGGGSYGCVWEAKILETGLHAVVKVVWPDPDLDGREAYNKSPPSREVLESFFREIQILEAIGPHPNVVEIMGATSDSTVIVLEQASTDLYYLLKKQKQPLRMETVRRWTKDILEGVDFLHRRKVSHRDIKSGNILVFPDKTAKICDFGLARGEIDDNMEVRREISTLWYRAPELVMGATRYCPKIDEWSVGCIMLEMLVGLCVFPGNAKRVCECNKASHINYNEDQLSKIFKLLGTPTDKKLLGRMECTEHFERWPVHPSRLQRTITNLTTAERCANGGEKANHNPKDVARFLVDSVGGLLAIDPAKRSTAKEAILALDEQEKQLTLMASAAKESGLSSPIKTDAPKSPTPLPTSAEKGPHKDGAKSESHPYVPEPLVRRMSDKAKPMPVHVGATAPHAAAAAGATPAEHSPDKAHLSGEHDLLDSLPEKKLSTTKLRRPSMNSTTSPTRGSSLEAGRALSRETSWDRTEGSEVVTRVPSTTSNDSTEAIVAGTVAAAGSTRAARTAGRRGSTHEIKISRRQSTITINERMSERRERETRPVREAEAGRKMSAEFPASAFSLLQPAGAGPQGRSALQRGKAAAETDPGKSYLQRAASTAVSTIMGKLPRSRFGTAAKGSEGAPPGP
mmetsp:Transcript_25420/g.60758  ORF Transcript_25420/g.60758 Transcript_25420/m.60758 type:complete len:672 (+) Transcript_25420:309-2324(+)